MRPRPIDKTLPSGNRWRCWTWGEPSASAPLAVALHGFTGSGLDWELPVQTFGRDFGAWLAPDLPGHGGTVDLATDAAYSLTGITEDLYALITELPHPPVLFGYSMGGRAALTYALRHSHTLAGLILIGTSAGITDPVERVARGATDESLADRLARSRIEEFAQEWEQLPILQSQQNIASPWREGLQARRRTQNPRELARSLRQSGTATMAPEREHPERLAVPTLLAAGADDRKFVAIAHSLAGSLPHAKAISIPSAGHCAHLEQPQNFYNLCRAFLA